jgi:hypothetical protein
MTKEEKIALCVDCLVDAVKELHAAEVCGSIDLELKQFYEARNDLYVAITDAGVDMTKFLENEDD